ncbi:hypothetical protein N7488_007225 [Penicillium malachiteum]|nr:hypothetical protein N7488_007225 [Penicillium malachiteum]
MSPLGLNVLFILPLLGLTNAIVFPAPAATAIPNEVESTIPDPTPGIDINTIAALQRRGNTSGSDTDTDTEYYASYEWTTNSFLSGQSSVCGWIDHTLGNEIVCPEGKSCVFHNSNTNFPGMAGCCSGMDCQFETTCVNYAQITESPDAFSEYKPFTIYCDDPSSPACVTWKYPTIDVTDFGCDTTSSLNRVYTWATPYWVTGTVEVIESVYMVTVNDDTVKAYEASWSSSTSATKGGMSVARVSSNTATATASTHHSPGSSSSSSSSTGAIAGGVVGGVVGAATISAAAFFFFLRKRKNRVDNSGDLDARGLDGYQTVPGNQVSAWEMQPANELESSEQERKVAEVFGRDPSDRAHEMHSTATSRSFIAELPADYTHNLKGTDYDSKP